ncbi:polyprenyl synthetase family protein [Micromonospora sp. BRA006-A]|nr:polyprenyl synthetase family protein [Micromonospora sp. BRA006-A]
MAGDARPARRDRPLRAAAGGKDAPPDDDAARRRGGGRIATDVLAAALGTEYLHVATLVHDDIIDADTLRRGRPAVPVAYGIPGAIVAGDHLIFHAFQAIVEGSRAAPRPRSSPPSPRSPRPARTCAGARRWRSGSSATWTRAPAGTRR